MNYLSQIFEHPLSTHAFIIGNALFAVLAIGVVAFIRANTQSNRSRTLTTEKVARWLQARRNLRKSRKKSVSTA